MKNKFQFFKQYKNGYNSKTIYFRIYVYIAFFPPFWLPEIISRNIKLDFPDTLYTYTVFIILYQSNIYSDLGHY